MTITNWLKNLVSLKSIKIEKPPYPMAKEGDVKSPRKWLTELYGETPEPKKNPKFIHAEKNQIKQSSTKNDQNLSRILEDILDEKPSKPHTE